MAQTLTTFVSVLIVAVLCSSCYGEVTKAVNRKITYDHPSLTFSQADQSERRSSTGKTFNVEDFGAKGDGSSDDTQAFSKAWKKACSSSGSVFLVPSGGNYYLKPITFSGPCKSNTVVQIYGNILASKDRSDYNQGRHWLRFHEIDNLMVEGGGSIDGNGKTWWKKSCKVDDNNPCKGAPTAVTFFGCNNLQVRNLKVRNAQQMHVTFDKCNNVMASGLKITAPESSPNTDGIHITGTKNIVVSNAVIGTGDDCISIENGSQKVRAVGITCGPGHGISIGSLGDDNSKAHVSDVLVNGATFSGTQNGVRIKTWQGGSGTASNIRFQNIELNDVKNPIIIDQNYCDQDSPCEEQASAVQVSNVLYKNISGTSASEDAVKFDCSENYPCEGIVMQNVQIERSETEKKAQATCKNVHLSQIGTVTPQCSDT